MTPNRQARRRARMIACAAALALLGAAALAYGLVPREPIYQGRPISEWIEQLTGYIGNYQGSVASPTLPQLVQQNPGPEIVPYLRATLRRGAGFLSRYYAAYYPRLPAAIALRLPRPNPARDAQLRYRAALILYYIGPRAKDAALDLQRALRDVEPDVRRVAAASLGSIGAAAKSSEPALAIALRDSSPGVRRAALKALSEIEPDPTLLAPLLTRALKDPEDGVRIDAAQQLRDLGPGAESAAPALAQALQDRNADVLRFSAMALGKIGPAARECLPALTNALRENRPYTETTIRWAIRQIARPPSRNQSGSSTLPIDSR